VKEAGKHGYRYFPTISKFPTIFYACYKVAHLRGVEICALTCLDMSLPASLDMVFIAVLIIWYPHLDILPIY